MKRLKKSVLLLIKSLIKLTALQNGTRDKRSKIRGMIMALWIVEFQDGGKMLSVSPLSIN